ncbi:Uncharacterised protein (plasmid) [Mesomycoplasma conjunctivae]|uniref:Extracellular matrix-binding protein ebh GA module domain-containing protein n=1 Tax=Mycoplasmopsis fermentans (strain M64) TaxID=943945 RepID=A0AB32XBL5_MYCFM|nr:hypothetical protein [Mycoplasmopsis fermentans]ADV34436.1 Hypothetical Protein MfeM64YM_0436 [Mycoplasmopsis fermentans M64]VEU64147.1 Uncharacterised protein [Mycoplasmopsis fermentans]VEU67598.1 Uncharacterised protein [Mesomycoplasma conjunctivae]
MKNSTKKIVALTMGISAGIVGAVSAGTLIGYAVDHSNYKKEKLWIENNIKYLKESNQKLKEKDNKLKEIWKKYENQEWLSSLWNELSLCQTQIDSNEKLIKDLQGIIDQHSSYHVGRRFGNKSYMRAVKHSNEKKIIQNLLPEMVERTKQVINQSEYENIKKSIQDFVVRSNDLLTLKTADEKFVDANSKSELNSLELKIKDYQNTLSKIEEEALSSNTKPNISTEMINKAADFIKSDFHVWNDKIIKKYVKKDGLIKKFMSNIDKIEELSAKIEDANTIASNNSPILNPINAVKKILLSRFDSNNYDVILEKNGVSVNRSVIIEDIIKACKTLEQSYGNTKEYINRYVNTFVKTIENTKLFNKSQILDLSNKSLTPIINGLNEFNSFVESSNQISFEKLDEFINKIQAILNVENDLTTSIQSVIKEFLNAYNSNADSIETTVKLAKLNNSKQIIDEFVQKSKIELSSLKWDNYIEGRNKLINEYVNSKNELDSIKNGFKKAFVNIKSRLNEFNLTLEANKTTLNEFNLFETSYKSIIDIQTKLDPLLKANLDSDIDNKIDNISTFFEIISNLKEYETNYLKIFEIIKNATDLNLQKVNNFASKPKEISKLISNANPNIANFLSKVFDNLKTLDQFEDVKKIIEDINNNKPNLSTKEISSIENSEIQNDKEKFKGLFEKINLINNFISSINEKDKLYSNFLENEAQFCLESYNEMDAKLAAIANVDSKVYEYKNKIFDAAIEAYKNVNSTENFSAVQADKDNKVNFVKKWFGVLNYYNEYVKEKAKTEQKAKLTSEQESSLVFAKNEMNAIKNDQISKLDSEGLKALQQLDGGVDFTNNDLIKNYLENDYLSAVKDLREYFLNKLIYLLHEKFNYGDVYWSPTKLYRPTSVSQNNANWDEKSKIWAKPKVLGKKHLYDRISDLDTGGYSKGNTNGGWGNSKGDKVRAEYSWHRYGVDKGNTTSEIKQGEEIENDNYKPWHTIINRSLTGNQPAVKYISQKYPNMKSNGFLQAVGDDIWSGHDDLYTLAKLIEYEKTVTEKMLSNIKKISDSKIMFKNDFKDNFVNLNDALYKIKYAFDFIKYNNPTSNGYYEGIWERWSGEENKSHYAIGNNPLRNRVWVHNNYGESYTLPGPDGNPTESDFNGPYYRAAAHTSDEKYDSTNPLFEYMPFSNTLFSYLRTVDHASNSFLLKHNGEPISWVNYIFKFTLDNPLGNFDASYYLWNRMYWKSEYAITERYILKNNSSSETVSIWDKWSNIFTTTSNNTYSKLIW